MTNTPNFPPIVITLTPQVAGALMSVTSAYAAVLSIERRLDYCIAELALWQGLHRAFLQGQGDTALAGVMSQIHDSITQLVEFSIREGLSE